MTEHEQLKEICDKIWFEIDHWFMSEYDIWEIDCRTDVQAIIFTEEFKDKYCHHMIYVNYPKYTRSEFNTVCNHLDNPVDYLYNLIK